MKTEEMSAKATRRLRSTNTSLLNNMETPKKKSASIESPKPVLRSVQSGKIQKSLRKSKDIVHVDRLSDEITKIRSDDVKLTEKNKSLGLMKIDDVSVTLPPPKTRRRLKAKRHLNSSSADPVSSGSSSQEVLPNAEIQEKRKRLQKQSKIPQQSEDALDDENSTIILEEPKNTDVGVEVKMNVKTPKKLPSPFLKKEAEKVLPLGTPTRDFTKSGAKTPASLRRSALIKSSSGKFGEPEEPENNNYNNKEKISTPITEGIEKISPQNYSFSKFAPKTPASLKRVSSIKSNVAKFDKVISGRVSKRQTFSFARAFTTETPEALHVKNVNPAINNRRKSAHPTSFASKTPIKAANLNETFEKIDDSTESFSEISSKIEAPKKRRTYELEETITEFATLKNASTPSTPVPNQNLAGFTPANDFDFGKSPGDNESGRRTTQQLQKSIIETSILKLASEQDESLNQATNFTNITMRRKFNIPNIRSGSINSSYSSPATVLEISDSPVFKTPSKLANRKALFNNSTPIVQSVETSEDAEDSISSSVNKAKSSSFSFRSKVKMPNFALIHQKQAEKMEDIQSYQLRKDERAKFLLSGQKPEFAGDKSVRVTRNKKTLRFAPDVVDVEKPALFIPLPNTPVFKSKPPVAPVEDLKNKIRTPLKIKLDNNVNPFNLIKKTPNKLKKKDFKPKEGYTRFGFKLPAINAPKTALKEMKKVVLAPSTTGRVEKRREHIIGVRSNRRFDLLMQMRKNK